MRKRRLGMVEGCVRAMAFAGIVGFNASAQNAPAPEETTPPATLSATRPRPTYTPAPPDIKLMAADGLARTALVILRDIPDPAPDDYRISALALRIAQRLRPDGVDEELLRLEREAWQAAGDDREVMDATRKIVRLSPSDSVSLLAILNARIRALQDADQRLAAYDRLLGPEGESLDPAIRSRLALDAALIARENGDDAGFVQRLTAATTLDVTNKDAAVFYATYFLDRTDEVRDRADLLGNVLLADPTDAGAHTNLAIELFRRGAFRAASRFYNCATSLIVASGEHLGVNDTFDRYLVTWMAEGPEACEAQLQTMLNERLAAVTAARNQYISAGLDPGPEPAVRLPIRFELLRIAMGFASGDTAALESSIGDMAASVHEQLEMIELREEPFDKMTETEAEEATRYLLLDLVFARLWSGLQIDEAEADLNRIIEQQARRAMDSSGMERFRAMIEVRRGNIEQGIDRLKALADQDLAAALGVGIAHEAAGRRQEAIQIYARLALDHANSAIGASARARIQTLIGQPLAQTPTAAALDAWSSSFAPWLEELTGGPRRYIALNARHVRPEIDPLDRIEVELRLRNTSRWPLALGPETAISSRIMLTPRATVLGRDTQDLSAPEITDLNRRLRLMPGEELRAVIWAGRGSVGTLAQLTATQATQIRWRIMQGYRMNAERHFHPGAMSLSAETDLVSIRSIAERTDEELIVQIRDEEGRAFYEALIVAQGSGARRRPGENQNQNLDRRSAFATALAERLPSLDEFERAWALTIALPGGFFHADESIIDASREDPSPLVKAMLLVGPYRGTDFENPPDLSGDADPDVARMARIVNRTRAARIAQPSGK